MSQSSPIELQERIFACASSARGVDVRSFELCEPADIAERLVPAVASTLRCAIAICTEALDAYDLEVADEDLFGANTTSTSDVFEVDVEALLGRDAQRPVADVAFLCATELRPRLHRIEHLPPAIERWEAVAECSSALRRSIKSLSALELALCGAEALTPRLGHASQLSRSLEVRREYARLHQVVAGKDAIVSEEATADALVGAIRSAGTAIAILIGKDVYPELRIHDRRQLRELQVRLLAWLRVPHHDDAHVREGARLWRDLVGFTGLIIQVSRRQELVEHDARVIKHALESMRSLASGPASAELLVELEALSGLDLELDALLAGKEQDIARWLPVLERRRADRVPAASSSDAAATTRFG